VVRFLEGEFPLRHGFFRQARNDLDQRRRSLQQRLFHRVSQRADLDSCKIKFRACASATGVATSRKNYTRALTAIPTRAKWNDQNLHRHIDEHPQPRDVGLKLAPNVVGFALRSDPIVNSVVEVCDRFGGRLLMLGIRSGIELFQDEMSPGFYQRADPSQRISEMR